MKREKRYFRHDNILIEHILYEEYLYTNLKEKTLDNEVQFKRTETKN